jgi:Winged helix DNA-binding domain
VICRVRRRAVQAGPVRIGVPYRLVITDNGPLFAMTSRAGVHARVTDALSLAALNDGDALSFTRLQNMLDPTPGNLITHLREFEDAGYLTSEKTWDGAGSTTTGTFTTRGCAALDAYTEAPRNLLGGLAS